MQTLEMMDTAKQTTRAARLVEPAIYLHSGVLDAEAAAQVPAANGKSAFIVVGVARPNNRPIGPTKFRTIGEG